MTAPDAESNAVLAVEDTCGGTYLRPFTEELFSALRAAGMVVVNDDLRAPQWDDDEAQTGLTCDWGFCNRATVAERRAYDYPGEEWLPVCLDHLAGPPVLVDPAAIAPRCPYCGLDHSGATS